MMQRLYSQSLNKQKFLYFLLELQKYGLTFFPFPSISNLCTIIYNKMKFLIVLVLLFLNALQVHSAVSFSVLLGDSRINALTNYTWRLTFSQTNSRNWMAFTFPSACILTSNSVSYIGNIAYPKISQSSNFMNISSTGLSITGSMDVVITNVTNPFSTLTLVSNFWFSSDLDPSMRLPSGSEIQYISGVLTCGWSFNQCTQQANSQLTITLNTANYIPANQQATFVVGFPSVWTNQNLKSLFWGGPTLTCSLSINGLGRIYGVGCTNTSSTISVTYSPNAQINGSSQIMIYVQGVMSPPTQTTPADIQYTATIKDASGHVIDDSAGSSCNIAPVCITSYTNGVVSPSLLTINTPVTALTTVFTNYPTITFMRSDIVTLIYSQALGMTSCTTFRVIRNNITNSLTSSFSGGTMSYTFPSSGGTASNLPDYNYGFTTTIYLQCSSYVTPLSETPATLTFTFKRNNAIYMQLSGTFNAVASTFNSSNGLLALTNYQMAYTGVTYTFNFTTGQALGPNPSFILIFPSDISITGVTCMIGVNAPASTIACTHSSSNLVINYSGGINVPSGSSIVIKVAGITNPLLPSPYNFGLTTYYNSNVVTSKVESNLAAFRITYTAITNLAVTLAPSNFTVYTLTLITMTFICPTNIPQLSTFTLTFPTQVTQLTSSAQMLSVNSGMALLNGTPTSSGSIVTFVNLQAIPITSNVVISMSIISPNYVNVFPSIQLTATQGTSTFFQSTSSMPISVTVPGVMPVTITPYYPLTGATSSYLITITLTIPHSDTFTLDVSAATDTFFISSAASCTSSCSNLLLSGANGFTVTINNPYPNSTAAVNIPLNFTHFSNSRNIGQGLPWTIITKNTANNIISIQTASPTITVPNLLTGKLDQTQSYYRNNTKIVKVQLTVVNRLQATDYILFTMGRTTYNVFTTVGCSASFATCDLETNKSTTNVLVIRAIPVNILANPLEIWIQGLVSGLNTNYLQTNYITVGTYSSSGNLIDQGKIAYNISCRDAATLTKNCKTCSGGNCIDCYTQQGYYLSGTACVTSCGDSTNYFSFANSTTGKCQSCSGTSSGCKTCINSTACLTCLNSSYYLYPSSLTCSMICPTSLGFITITLGGEPVCMPCSDSNCLVCSTIYYGSCTLCNNNSILVSGICSSSCPGSYYVFSANCIACDPSCYSCYGSTNTSCTKCAVNYFNYSGFCTQTCPTGTAKILFTGICGCASSCLTCDSTNYANCLSCLNTSEFVYNGQCVSSCPTASYQVNTSCLACSSGCLTCTSTSCLACSSNWYIYGNQCYSDCNFISQQHDASGIRCVLCPTGCDTCYSGSCTSCLTDYSLLSNSCVQTCQLTNSCSSDTGNTLPLPGCIAVFVWSGVVVLVHLVLHKNYIPYSMVVFSTLVQFILVLAVILNSNATVGRLLTYLQSSTKVVIIGLLAFTVCINYVTNFIYLYIFIKYIKPLIVNPKQIDIFSNVVVLVVAMLTNYRFAIIAFAKLFPKPNIHIQMPKYLTPVHYLCMGSVILSIFPIIAAGVGLSKSQKLTPLFMLSMDLMIIIIFNILITFWFIMSKKEDSYFENEQKKEYTSENMDNIDINVTKQNMIVAKHQKDASDVNMIMSMHDSEEKNSQQSDQYDFGQSYKKLKAKKTKITGKRDNNTVLIKHNSIQSDPKVSNQIDNNSERIQQISKSPQRNIFAIENQYEPQTTIKGDVNFEQRVQKRGMTRLKDRMSRVTTVNQSRPELLKQEIPHRTIQLDQNRFQKEFFVKQISKEKEQFDIASSADDHQIQFDQTKTHFSDLSMVSKIRKEIPKRDANNTNLGLNKNYMTKSVENQTVMKKNHSKRYAQADSTARQEQKGQKEDLAAIIKLKIQESSIRRSQNITVLSNQQNDLQEISPSYYNIQNQRFQIEDMENL